MGCVAFAFSVGVKLKGAPTVAGPGLPPRMGATGAGATVTVIGRLALPAALLASSVTGKLPAAAGVPVNSPVLAFSVSQAGKGVAGSTEKLMGCVAFAFSVGVKLKGVPTVAAAGVPPNRGEKPTSASN